LEDVGTIVAAKFLENVRPDANAAQRARLIAHCGDADMLSAARDTLVDGKKILGDGGHLALALGLFCFEFLL
jgi:hypothetical protein